MFAQFLRISAAGAALAAAACATPADREAGVRSEIEAQLAMAEEEGLVCEYRQVFGSLRRERICFDPVDVQENSDRGRAQLERVQRSTQPDQSN